MTCKTPAMTAVFFEVSVNVLFHSPLERECTGPYISLLSCSGDMLVLGVNVSCVSGPFSSCAYEGYSRLMHRHVGFGCLEEYVHCATFWARTVETENPDRRDG